MFMQFLIEGSMRIVAACALALLVCSSLAFALPITTGTIPDTAPLSTPAAARTCKQVSTCEEAVRLWCGGYGRADADKDGIPCENVCRTKEQVDAIRARIGC